MAPKNEAHIWTARLDASKEALAHFNNLLDPGERERAARFHCARHHNRFVAVHGILRSILGQFLRTSPAELEFVYGRHGKPSLRGNEVYFNLAHCEDLAVVAVNYAAEVGIDLEQIRVLEDFENLVESFFSSTENAVFQKLGQDDKPEAFFNLWTRKEAWLKATGDGIGSLLNRVEVSFLPGEPARLLKVPANSHSLTDWTLRAFTPAPGFVAALALCQPDAQVHFHSWPRCLVG